MFLVGISLTFSETDIEYDFELPQVPAVGDTIRIMAGTNERIYGVLARRFHVSFSSNMVQQGSERPMVLLHVEEVA